MHPLYRDTDDQIDVPATTPGDPLRGIGRVIKDFGRDARGASPIQPAGAGQVAEYQGDLGFWFIPQRVDECPKIAPATRHTHGDPIGHGRENKAGGGRSQSPIGSVASAI
jgi:hypothetical protein